MDLGLTDKKVFITASSAGIGYAIAERFVTEGATVVINGREIDKLEKARKALSVQNNANVFAFQYDMSKSLNGAMTTISNGKIDILVANLGSGKPQTDDPLDEAEWNRILNINLLSAVRLIHDCLPNMNDGGSIVVVASIAGMERTGAPIAYSIAKSGLIALVKNLSGKLVSRGIRINAVAPGNIYYDGGRWDEMIKKDKKAVFSMIESQVPMQRFGRPAEVADTVAFLASKVSSFTTGATVPVDGGQTRGY